MQNIDFSEQILSRLDRIASALDRLSGVVVPEPTALGTADGYHWDGRTGALQPVMRINAVPYALLKGLGGVLPALLKNTVQFAHGHGANNVLLWGARGMGKSSAVKAVHERVKSGLTDGTRLVLIEISREDIESLPALLRVLTALDARFIVFCDDLSFDRDETSYKSLKSILDGGIEGRPDNVVFYATSNRRHLMARDMIDNERSTAINPSEAVEEKVSLSDRFGLWLGFHNCDQETYLDMVSGYVAHYGIPIAEDVLRAKAIEWAQTRGARSGRVAIQLVRQLAGEAGMDI